MKLLLRKFEDPGSGDVNYPAFVQAVDQGNGIIALFIRPQGCKTFCSQLS